MSNLDNPDIRKMLFTDNDKTNFVCGYSPEPKLIAETTEIIDTNKIDYMLNNEPEPEDYVSNEMKDKQKTISYLSVKSVEEGIEWYRKEFPKLPEELLPLMARWNWGDLSNETKKSVKNKRKKQAKKEKPTFKIEHKPVVITFN